MWQKEFCVYFRNYGDFQVVELHISVLKELQQIMFQSSSITAIMWYLYRHSLSRVYQTFNLSLFQAMWLPGTSRVQGSSPSCRLSCVTLTAPAPVNPISWTPTRRACDSAGTYTRPGIASFSCPRFILQYCINTMCFTIYSLYIVNKTTPLNTPIKTLINQSTLQSTNQSTCQSTKQTNSPHYIYQPVNHPNNIPFYYP